MGEIDAWVDVTGVANQIQVQDEGVFGKARGGG
jgi:hypothetical protein